MAFDALQRQISDLFKDSVFSIPRNQRRYVWNKQNWQEFLEDILNVANKNAKSHFLGSVVLMEDGKKDGLEYYTIIDGQQRVTTIIIMLSSIMKLFHENNMIDDFNGTKKYLRPTNLRNKEVPALESDFHLSISNVINKIIEISSDDNKKSISSFLESIVPYERDKVIKDCFRFFYDEIKEYISQNDDTNEILLDIRNALIEIYFVKITATTEEDSYTIFEILNARGQDLEDHELLKNYIMRHIIPEVNRDMAKTIWDEIEKILGDSIKKFIKHYTTHKFGNPAEKSDSFYRFIQKTQKTKIKKNFSMT
ncbi:MAG: DUF262 domain-containing protein [Bacteroidales bacterium]